MKTLLVDNHDSFTFNLFHLLARVNGEEPIVLGNDALTLEDAAKLSFDNIVISPGPGRPDVLADFGICTELIRHAEVPLLGVCLGHQGIASAFGARVRHAPIIMHGRTSRIRHRGTGLFAGLPGNFQAVRYHSLHVETPLPELLEATAFSEDGILMGLRHRTLPLFGVQFHPESIATEHGIRLFENFRNLTPRRARSRTARTETVPVPRSPELELVHRELETRAKPEHVFTELVAAHPDAFWLDGATTSFMGGATGPLGLRIETQQGHTRVTDASGVRMTETSVWELLRQVLAERHLPSSLPFELNGGFVGYVGYEAQVSRRAPPRHRATLPDVHLLFADRLIAFEAETQKTHVFSLCRPSDRAASQSWVNDTCRAIEELGEPHRRPATLENGHPVRFRFRRDRRGYLEDIQSILAAIREGETYEVCLTNLLEADCTLDPLSFYRTLRAINPAPYSAFLRVGQASIACSSPERFLRVFADGTIESKPIKGTRPRGATPAEDVRLRTELATSEKDRSENLMIVDLVRHDLGRVCEVGTVEVPALMSVDTFEHVHQLVSTVRGKLASRKDAVEAFCAAFPGGSMTGAPKERTLALIDALEPGPRGVYSGALGYFACSGAADFNIVIRTAVLTPGKISLGVGGAIVALSDPQAELEELLVKAKPLLRAAATEASGSPDGYSLIEDDGH